MTVVRNAVENNLRLLKTEGAVKFAEKLADIIFTNKVYRMHNNQKTRTDFIEDLLDRFEIFDDINIKELYKSSIIAVGMVSASLNYAIYGGFGSSCCR